MLNYEHRRQWILDRLEVLAKQFSVEVCAYAIMSNHYHLVLHVDYEQSLTWDAEEVVKRWCTLFPPQALKDSDDKQIDTEVVNAYFARLTADEEKVTLWRERLADLSWFMRCLNEPIARQANKEDECTGRFWEGRFKSQALLDDAALISCMAYVDLNPVRAAIAQTPEDSEFTSFAARVEIQKKSVSKPEPQSQWLLPFAETKKTGKPQVTQNQHICLPISQEEYFELVD
ncbi:transposase, partial [Candidatus Venteria ishoeyi]|uniref:transposase n=1 Tax=Candidatus Venteria ishoeyi TaxID=1899563 RepID=UPI000AC10B59